MNATGCVTALGDGSEAFIVLMPNADCGRSRRPEQTPCLVSRPPTPPSPSTVTDAYKSRPLQKDRGAFVVLPEVPVAGTTPTRSATICSSGRVSPFRGRGFKTPENGQSRASSPSSAAPLKRQSSEPRMAANRRRPATVKQRLSTSTKDLSVSAGKPPLAPTTPAKVKTSPRRKKLPSAPPTPRKPAPIKSPSLPAKSPLPPKSPLPSRSPKTPRRPPPSSTAVRTVVNTPTKPTANRQPPVKLSQRQPKKQHTSVTFKSIAPPSLQTPAPKVEVQRQSDDGGQLAVDEVTQTRTMVQMKTVALEQLKVIATSVAEATPVTQTSAVCVAPITASTSATVIATTHATNAVVSPVVSGGPLMTVAPPPAALAANTLATLSVIEPPMAATTTSLTSNSKPPQSTMRSREPPATAPSHAKAAVIVVDDASSRAAKVQPAATTPPLSYELQEIVVEPEIENLSGRNAVIRSVAGSNVNKITSTLNSHNNNNHKTVAWSRQSDKVIVPEEPPVDATKDPAYKSWAAAWKRRPRLCGRCRVRKRSERNATVDTVGVQRRRWWRRWTQLWHDCVKWRKQPASSGGNSGDSVGALGIAPPTMPPAETFFDKLKRRLCCCNFCVVPSIVRRFCCFSRNAGGPGRPNAPKKLADRQRSLFKCTSCCTNIPKLDAVYVDHSSVMKGAIPVLPVTLAWLCLVFNVIFPGSGTFSSGILCLCVGKPRFTVNDNFQSRVGAFCVNFVVAAAQLFTVLFCLVGWGWSIWWGVIMLKMAKKYQKVKVIDQPVEEPITVNHNHQV